MGRHQRGRYQRNDRRPVARPRRVGAAAALALAAILGFGAPARAAEDARLLGAWRVVSLAGEAIPADATLEIAFAAGGALDGSGGCNRFSGGYALDGGKLALGPLRATQRACEGPAMEREGAFFAFLGAVDGFAIEGGRLTLLAADGRRLVLVRG